MTFTSNMLVEFARNAVELKAKYWYGTYWNPASQSLLTSKTSQYPSHYGSSRTSTYKQHINAGLMVADCVGLIKGFFWSENGTRTSKYATNGCPDTNANGMYKLCTECGAIGTLPETPGLLLWSSGHIGVYIGDGYAVEARGYAYGVVKTKVSARSWTHWGKLPLLEYPEDSDTDYRPTLSRGNTGSAVLRMQSLLLADDASCLPKYGADSDFGSETETALKKYQTKYRLSVDGICGTETWAALLGEVALVPVEDDNDYTDPEPDDEPTNPYAEPSKNLAKGSKGDGVRWVQWALINAGYSCGVYGIDGDFGSKTRSAVIDYQTDKGLSVDGVVGPKTRAALKTESAEVESSIKTDTATAREPVIIDLSQHNDLKTTKNDWAKIATNVDLIILRCGVTRTSTAPIGIGIDDHFAYAAQQCAEHGIPFGVYYYGKVSSADEARKEARKAYETASPHNPLFYVYDVEESRLTTDCVTAWMDEIRSLGAKKVGLYIAHQMYGTFKTAATKADFVWLPRYGKNTGDYDPTYAPAHDCDLHQYTSVGSVAGLNDTTIDLNRLTGTKSLSWFLE